MSHLLRHDKNENRIYLKSQIEFTQPEDLM